MEREAGEAGEGGREGGWRPESEGGRQLVHEAVQTGAGAPVCLVARPQKASEPFVPECEDTGCLCRDG